MNMTQVTRIVLFEPDLIFSSKIEAIASRLNIEVRLVTSLADLLQELRKGTSSGFVISLDSLEGELSALGRYRNEMSNAVGYYSHVNIDLAEEAKRAGLRTLLSRGAFAGKMQEIFQEISTKHTLAGSG